MSFDTLIFLCVSFCTSSSIFVQYISADHFSVFISFIIKKKALKWVLCVTSPTPGNPFLMTEQIRWRRETWWWNEHVEKVIAAKQKAFKAWKTGKGTRASYDRAKRNARHAVHQARQEADKKVYENTDPKSSNVYCLANQFRRENTDVVGDKPVKNDAGEISMSEDSKQKAWLEYNQGLLNT